MENTIRNLHAAKDCFAKYSTEQLLCMDNQELKVLCISERINLIESINKVETKDLIKERIEIIHAKDREQVQKRKDFLNTVFR